MTFKWLASKWDWDDEDASFYSPITPSNNKNHLNADLFNHGETSKIIIS